MKNKVTFALAFMMTILLHSYVLNTTQIKQTLVTVQPQKKVSPIINLQRVVLKQEPVVEPIVEPVVKKEVLPELPEPVVEPIVVPPKKIKKKALKKVVKKPKILKKKIKKKKVIKKKIVKKKKKIKKKRLVKKVTKKTKVSKKASITKRSSPKQKAMKRSYLAKIRSIIEKKKKYPRAAKRMKQEGVVSVHFTISKNGQIKQLRLAKKCPYAKLNKAAMHILKKIGSFPPIPHHMDKSYLSLTIPIRYQILN